MQKKLVHYFLTSWRSGREKAGVIMVFRVPFEGVKAIATALETKPLRPSSNEKVLNHKIVWNGWNLSLIARRTSRQDDLTYRQLSSLSSTTQFFRSAWPPSCPLGTRGSHPFGQDNNVGEKRTFICMHRSRRKQSIMQIQYTLFPRWLSLLHRSLLREFRIILGIHSFAQISSLFD